MTEHSLTFLQKEEFLQTQLHLKQMLNKLETNYIQMDKLISILPSILFSPQPSRCVVSSASSGWPGICQWYSNILHEDGEWNTQVKTSCSHLQKPCEGQPLLQPTGLERWLIGYHHLKVLNTDKWVWTGLGLKEHRLHCLLFRLQISRGA